MANFKIYKAIANSSFAFAPIMKSLISFSVNANPFSIVIKRTISSIKLSFASAHPGLFLSSSKLIFILFSAEITVASNSFSVSMLSTSQNETRLL